MELINYPKDVWASGQMGSKLWLCNIIEELWANESKQNAFTVWLLGGWAALLAQNIFVRDRMNISKIRSFDLDPSCIELADTMLENWVWQAWKFKAFCVDCNKIEYQANEMWQSDSPDLVINTSVEHFESKQWFDRIPSGTRVVIQSNNMKHDDHVALIETEDQLLECFPVSQKMYLGNLHFDYKNETSFTRFMLAGIK